jgi:hypothetical protein
LVLEFALEGANAPGWMYSGHGLTDNDFTFKKNPARLLGQLSSRAVGVASSHIPTSSERS